jgi:hypothetical protein
VRYEWDGGEAWVGELGGTMDEAIMDCGVLGGEHGLCTESWYMS